MLQLLQYSANSFSFKWTLGSIIANTLLTPFIQKGFAKKFLLSRKFSLFLTLNEMARYFSRQYGQMNNAHKWRQFDNNSTNLMLLTIDQNVFQFNFQINLRKENLGTPTLHSPSSFIQNDLFSEKNERKENICMMLHLSAPRHICPRQCKFANFTCNKGIFQENSRCCL